MAAGAGRGGPKQAGPPPAPRPSRNKAAAEREQAGPEGQRPGWPFLQPYSPRSSSEPQGTQRWKPPEGQHLIQRPEAAPEPPAESWGRRCGSRRPEEVAAVLRRQTEVFASGMHARATGEGVKTSTRAGQMLFVCGRGS